MLIGTPPARQVLAQQAGSLRIALEADGQTGTLIVTPGTVGPNHYRLELGSGHEAHLRNPGVTDATLRLEPARAADGADRRAADRRAVRRLRGAGVGAGVPRRLADAAHGAHAGSAGLGRRDDPADLRECGPGVRSRRHRRCSGSAGIAALVLLVLGIAGIAFAVVGGDSCLSQGGRRAGDRRDRRRDGAAVPGAAVGGSGRRGRSGRRSGRARSRRGRARRSAFCPELRPVPRRRRPRRWPGRGLVDQTTGRPDGRARAAAHRRRLRLLDRERHRGNRHAGVWRGAGGGRDPGCHRLHPQLAADRAAGAGCARTGGVHRRPANARGVRDAGPNAGAGGAAGRLRNRRRTSGRGHACRHRCHRAGAGGLLERRETSCGGWRSTATIAFASRTPMGRRGRSR